MQTTMVSAPGRVTASCCSPTGIFIGELDREEWKNFINDVGGMHSLAFSQAEANAFHSVLAENRESMTFDQFQTGLLKIKAAAAEGHKVMVYFLTCACVDYYALALPRLSGVRTKPGYSTLLQKLRTNHVSLDSW